MERHSEAVKLAFAPSAQLAAIYVNAHLKDGAEQVTPANFIPGMEDDRNHEAPELQEAAWRKWAEQRSEKNA